MKVCIYRNVNRKGHIYSIKMMEGALKGKVIGYAKCLLIENCELKVSEAGRQRVLKQKRKNVHAGIVGDLVAVAGYETRLHYSDSDFEYYCEEVWRKKYPPGAPINYNPYLNSSFVIEGTQSPVKKAQRVQIFNSKVYAYFNPEK